MAGAGGFEGNAQTFRILARLEKKLDDLEAQRDERERISWFTDEGEIAVGLNLCSRSLAAILKYDKEIKVEVAPGSATFQKGYYASESEVVQRVRKDVLGRSSTAPLRTVECQIMDLADDIAYSTYDLEDAFKARLLSPLEIVGLQEAKLERVAEKVTAELEEELGGRLLVARDVQDVLRGLFHDNLLNGLDRPLSGIELQSNLQRLIENSTLIVENGYYRTIVTSALVDRFVQAVTIDLNSRQPRQSKVGMPLERRLEVSVLKQLTFVTIIETHRMRLVNERARGLLERIYSALTDTNGEGFRLLPPDFADRYDQARDDESARRRVVCDFIAGMTDRHAADFYGRLSSASFQSMFRLH